jgi:hypothetical protein
MLQPDADPRQRQLLVIGIEPQRHRRAGAERGQQKIVGAEAAAEPARILRLVGDQMMPAGDDFLLELTMQRFAHDDSVE